MSKIYRAKSIITMSPNQPRATHIAVRDGRILAVGDASAIDQWQASWGEMDIDTQFADNTLLPGFVEGHSHCRYGCWLWSHFHSFGGKCFWYFSYYDSE